ncbi:MAG: hypothetical protein ACE5LV_05580 [Candidatus Aminicenantales bacterium]
MDRTASSVLKRGSKVGFILLLWVIAAWLLYPMIVLDTIQMASAKAYLYRAAIGIAIMLILFGKTIFDLMFPQTHSSARSLLHTVFLTLYTLAIAGGILFMVARMIVLYIRQESLMVPF